MTVVVVDWLGRGGISQFTRVWLDVCARRGRSATVVTRAGRELCGDGLLAPADGPHPLVTHRRVAALAAQTIDELDPELVIVQNYVVPALERTLDDALARSRARTIVVMHDHRHNSRFAGNRAGLRRRLRRADVVVTHSEYVAEHLRSFSGRSDLTVIPLPAPDVGRIGTDRVPPGPSRTAISFGVMKRRYKGTQSVESLAATGVPGWRFVIAGVGAPEHSQGVVGIPGFLDAGDLAASVGGADSALMPYRVATQSGAIPLAQSLGTVPIATAVGGLVEQIDHGRDGILLEPGAGLDAWRTALETVAADGPTLAANGRRRATRLAAAFDERAGALLSA